jgi:hypothetical protein
VVYQQGVEKYISRTEVGRVTVSELLCKANDGKDIWTSVLKIDGYEMKVEMGCKVNKIQ